MRAHDCTPAFLTILGWIASPGLALPCLRLAPGLALLASAGVAPGLAFKPHLPCLLPLLLVSPVLSGPPTPPPESPLSLPEKIFNKIGELVETEKREKTLPSEWDEEECGSSREHMWPAKDQQPDEKPHGRHWRDCQVKIIQIIVMSKYKYKKIRKTKG